MRNFQCNVRGTLSLLISMCQRFQYQIGEVREERDAARKSALGWRAKMWSEGESKLKSNHPSPVPATCGRPEAECKRNLIPEQFEAFMDHQKVWTKAETDNVVFVEERRRGCK